MSPQTFLRLNSGRGGFSAAGGAIGEEESGANILVRYGKLIIMIKTL